MQKIMIKNTETGEETEATPEQMARLIDELHLQLQNQYNVLTDLRQEFAELEKQNEWQPIETAPKDGTEILIYDSADKKIYRSRWYDVEDVSEWDCDDCDLDAGFYELNKCFNNYDDYFMALVAPTRWVPLPKAPEGK